VEVVVLERLVTLMVLGLVGMARLLQFLVHQSLMPEEVGEEEMARE
jgi:hypothetical protein